MYEYLVKFENLSKEFKVENNTVKCLISEINKSLPAHQQLKVSDIVVRVFSSKWAEYVDIDGEDLPAENAKLLLEPNKESVSSPAMAILPAVTDDVVEEATPSTSSEKKPFPVVYRLPKFPFKVHNILSKGKSDKEKRKLEREVRDNKKLRNLILDTLHKDMQQYTSYPEAAYSIVIQRLTSTYPGLKDEVSKCAPNFNANKSLQQKLRSRFKYERSVEQTPTDLQKEMRAKYGRKGWQSGAKPQEQPVAQRQNYPERPLLKLPENVNVGETDETVKQHIEKIKAEWEKLNPKPEIIADRMERTLLHRLSMYDKPLPEIMDSYPLLQDCFQLTADFKRYYDFSFKEKMLKWLTPKRTDFLLQKISALRQTKTLALASESDDLDRKRTCVMYALPLLFKEKIEWVKEGTEAVGGSPAIYCSSSPLLEDTSFKVMLDKCIISDNPPDLMSAFDALFSAVYLFNVKFPETNTRGFRFVSEEMCCLPSTKARPQSIISLVNGLVHCDTCECEEDCYCSSPDE